MRAGLARDGFLRREGRRGASNGKCLSPGLREWVPEDHLVHFIMEAVKKSLLEGKCLSPGEVSVPRGSVCPQKKTGIVCPRRLGALRSERLKQVRFRRSIICLSYSLLTDRNPSADNPCRASRSELQTMRRRNVPESPPRQALFLTNKL
jgi:hypothetical protein